MNYSFDARNKADKWEVHNLETKIRELQNDNRSLERQIGNIEGKVRNYYTVIQGLITILLSCDTLPFEKQQELVQLQQYL